jgi:hypothetical protein
MMSSGEFPLIFPLIFTSFPSADPLVSLHSSYRTHLYGALTTLHGHGYQHNDFRPPNILLSSPTSLPILIDFARTESHECAGWSCAELRRARSDLGIEGGEEGGVCLRERAETRGRPSMRRAGREERHDEEGGLDH